jgi:hypothetical protein
MEETTRGDSPSALSLSKANLSLRDRVRQKVQSRRDKVQEETLQEEMERDGFRSGSTARRLRGLRDAKRLMARTRFDEAESKEEEELEQELAAR